MIDMGEDLFTGHIIFLHQFLLARRTFAMPTALRAIAVTDCGGTNDAQNKTGNQECKTFQTTFHNTVPPKMI